MQDVECRRAGKAKGHQTGADSIDRDDSRSDSLHSKTKTKHDAEDRRASCLELERKVGVLWAWSLPSECCRVSICNYSASQRPACAWLVCASDGASWSECDLRVLLALIFFALIFLNILNL